MSKLRGIRKLQMIPWSYLIGNQMCRSGFEFEPAAAPQQVASTAIIKVIKSDGRVMMYDRAINVSGLVLEFPKHKVCSSESLYIGKKITPLSQDDQLQLGQDYLLLPFHFFDSALTFATITSFAAASNIKTCPSLSNCQLFEIQKTDSGFLKIRVREEFIFRLIEAAAKEDEKNNKMMMMLLKEKNVTYKTPIDSNTWVKEKYCKFNDDDEDEIKSCSQVCTTPELRNEYKQLVLVGRSRPWKPKLEIIKETHGSEVKKSRSNRKRVALLLVAASFRVKKRSSVSNSSSSSSISTGGGGGGGIGVTPHKSSSRTTTIHKIRNKKTKKKK